MSSRIEARLNILRPRLAWALMVGLLGTAGAVHAQSCAPKGDAGTVCRLVLSEPRTFTVRAWTTLSQRARRPPHIAIKVNGAPCRGIWYSTNWRARSQCRVRFPATTSVIDVLAYGPDGVHTRGVNVTLSSDDSLASLPRDARDLYPKVQRRKLSLPVLPFHRRSRRASAVAPPHGTLPGPASPQ